MGRIVDLLLKTRAFPDAHLADRIIFALENLPLSYPQSLWRSFDATASSADY